MIVETAVGVAGIRTAGTTGALTNYAISASKRTTGLSNMPNFGSDLAITVCQINLNL